MLHLQNLSFQYTKQKPLFQSLDLDVAQGNIYGLLGKNGAGKSTLLKLIAGLLFPKSGTCQVMGYTPQEREPAFLSDLYFVSEEIDIPAISIADYERYYAPFYPKFDSAQFADYLQQFEIPTDQKLTELSYGQKKKVILSFGLATNSRLLILDEPTNGLDIPSKSLFRKIIAGAINDERTFIISTHQVRDMTNLIDPIIVLENSEIIFQQSLEAVMQKLSFHFHLGSELPAEVLFSERSPGGHQVVSKNETGEETEVELEALFNTIITNKEQIKQLFQ